MQELVALHLLTGDPGIASLVEAFEDDNYVYFVLEPCSAAEMTPIMPLEHVVVQRMRRVSILPIDLSCCAPGV